VRAWAKHALRVSAGLLVLCLAACGERENATFIEPAFGDPCKYETCSGHGSCDGSTGAPVCSCAPGYAGELCAACGPGYHLDALARCTADRHCADGDAPACGAHGVCSDKRGVVECTCDRGYEGARCQLCSSGYDRNDYEECLQVFLVNGTTQKQPEGCRAETCHNHGRCSQPDGAIQCACFPGYGGARCDLCVAGFSLRGDRCVSTAPCTASMCGACDNLSSSPDLPTAPDTCNSANSLELSDVTLLSMEGEGKVWVCAATSYYGINSEHVVLEVGKRIAAQVIFRTPITKMDFDASGGVFSGLSTTTLKFEVRSEGKVLSSFELHKGKTEPVSLTFSKPVSQLDFVSPENNTELALDSLSYEFDSATCKAGI
jgi:hypothetical protein